MWEAHVVSNSRLNWVNPEDRFESDLHSIWPKFTSGRQTRSPYATTIVNRPEFVCVCPRPGHDFAFRQLDVCYNHFPSDSFRLNSLSSIALAASSALSQRKFCSRPIENDIWTNARLFRLAVSPTFTAAFRCSFKRARRFFMAVPMMLCPLSQQKKGQIRSLGSAPSRLSP